MTAIIIAALAGSGAGLVAARWLNSAPAGSMRARIGVAILGGGGPGVPEK